MAYPLSNRDVATKNCVDTHALTTAGGVVSGDIKLSVGSDLFGSPGCNDLSAEDIHKFANLFRTQFRFTSAYQDKN